MPQAYPVSIVARERRAVKRILRVPTRGAGLAVGRGVEGDVDDGFEFNWYALACGRAELPLAQGLHGVGIELLVNAAHQLNAVDRTVAANHGVKHNLAFDMLVDQCGWVFRVDFP